MSVWLIDEDWELSIPDGNDFQTVYVRETVEGLRARIAADPKAAAQFVRTEAVNGSVAAEIAWGHMLLQGHGVAPDAEAALRWFRIAARSGSADALNMVGRCHELGWGVPRNGAEAAYWYRLAAAKNHAWAEFNLASLLARGEGIAPDKRAALTLLVRSARRGNAKAMNMIGRYREEGSGGQAKPRSAALWYHWAAERGCFRGQFHYARHLAAQGRVEEAALWIRKSLSAAPTAFRRDAVDMLNKQPIKALRQIAREMDISPERCPA